MKRDPIVHKGVCGPGYIARTACGIDVFFEFYTRDWSKVTCKRCLRVWKAQRRRRKTGDAIDVMQACLKTAEEQGTDVFHVGRTVVEDVLAEVERLRGVITRMARQFRLYAGIWAADGGAGDKIAVLAETPELVLEGLRRLGIANPVRVPQRVTVTEGWGDHTTATPIRGESVDRPGAGVAGE